MCHGIFNYFHKNDSIYRKEDVVIFHFDINTLKPEFTIVIFIHYKPRIAVAILDL